MDWILGWAMVGAVLGAFFGSAAAAYFTVKMEEKEHAWGVRFVAPTAAFIVGVVAAFILFQLGRAVFEKAVG